MDSILARRGSLIKLVAYVMAKSRPLGSRFGFAITGRSDEHSTHCVATPQRNRHGAE